MDAVFGTAKAVPSRTNLCGTAKAVPFPQVLSQSEVSAEEGTGKEGVVKL
jgi:hypothetical protein